MMDKLELLPTGRYVVRVNDTTGRTSNSGLYYVQLRLVVVEGEYSGRLVWHSLVPSHKGYAIQRWVDQVTALGISLQLAEDYLKPIADRRFGLIEEYAAYIAGQVIERICVATIGHREFKGDKHNYVDTLLPLAVLGAQK